jgi:RNase P/RNase MRP subunit p30
MPKTDATMPKTDATVMLFSDSQQQRASYHYRGEPADVITLLTCAGIDDPDFGDMLIQAALCILENLENNRQLKTNSLIR